MKQAREVPLSGYTIEKIYTYHQLLRHKEPGDEGTHGQIDVGWDWRLLPYEELTFEVRLSLTVEPTPDRDDQLAVGIVGRFRKVTDEPSVPLLDFVRIQAPAILLPYARQALSELSVNSYYGTYYLPPINVVLLMEDFDPLNTTGAKQLAELDKQVKATSSGSSSRSKKTKRSQSSGKGAKTSAKESGD